jgi:hypothetical protein
MMTWHISRGKVDEGILDHQVENCPTCNGALEESFGLAGGGFGIYGYCSTCERIVWKCVTEEDSA